eukprot:7285276-Heterocapsa_arctica.AAC.1
MSATVWGLSKELSMSNSLKAQFMVFDKDTQPLEADGDVNEVEDQGSLGLRGTESPKMLSEKAMT